ncbi:EEF1A lysine methyltransferase 1-like [Uloborus diversus]|uniref:EEF1A lysine methyltransferase 1-like n=1 Tax=Uloborus diversus TaxID=327109 RepID=UPI00240A455D|nr:EEF1A lysine methyltransferase 1-like [Uloborus diversus]XP_054714818.1 EEF1A lysine methyltransferase 1-like [Uloborus diversus]
MSDNEEITLSEHALKALQEFYHEQEELKISQTVCKEHLLAEDWELSQFWYDDSTASTLAEAAIKGAGKNGRIACISSPTVYEYLQRIKSDVDNYYLFEYDKRFQTKFADNFVFYDYNHPLKIDDKFKSYFDVVLVDPPYLSEECLEKTAETVKFIGKDKIILCTGAVMEEYAEKFLNLKKCNFLPQHERKLGNEFRCFANWNFDEQVNLISKT